VKCKDDAWGEYQSLFADSQVLEKIKATAGTGASRAFLPSCALRCIVLTMLCFPADLTLFVVRLLARLESALRQDANLFDDVRSFLRLCYLMFIFVLSRCMSLSAFVFC
jgi:hypothetical protein